MDTTAFMVTTITTETMLEKRFDYDVNKRSVKRTFFSFVAKLLFLMPDETQFSEYSEKSTIENLSTVD